ncbi:MAG: NAD(P)-dependent oxidoreductase [Bacteroidetes bacterium]|nr:NAD(P)-dependent oxidoreductase [Bacteroidota bacterium]MBU1678832.1 NAD(P)-dependent oxidoreductase [Bacteroidota bacterium]
MGHDMISVVTGASGFVGSHLVDLLLKEGHTVRTITRKSSSMKWLEEKNIENYSCGLDDKNNLREVLTDADCLFHVAGVVKAKTKSDYYAGNVTTTKNLLDVLIEINSQIKRVVVISSQTACGPSLNGVICTEETPPHPISTYGKSKLAQEELAKTYSNKLPITIVRPPAVYGERDTEIFLVFKTYKQGLMTLIGFAKKEVSLIHVQDLVEGIYLSSIKSEAVGKTYFISSKKYYNWKQISSVIGEAFGQNAFELKIPHTIVYTIAAIAQFFSIFSSKTATFNLEKARDFVQSAWTCDISKAERELGFHPKVSIEEGIKRTIDWYTEQKWL